VTDLLLIAGFAANKMTGGHHGGMASAGGGAMLAQGGKMLYDMYKKNHSGGHPQQGYNNQGYNQGYQGQSGGEYLVLNAAHSSSLLTVSPFAPGSRQRRWSWWSSRCFRKEVICSASF
jgi:hypothetical protein